MGSGRDQERAESNVGQCRGRVWGGFSSRVHKVVSSHLGIIVNLWFKTLVFYRLRARFESMRDSESSRTPSRSVKVNRFVVSDYYFILIV